MKTLADVVADTGFARAEARLAAEIEKQLRPEPALEGEREAVQPAEVVAVTVRQHQRIEPGGIDAQPFELFVQRRRGRAEVDQHLAPGLFSLRQTRAPTANALAYSPFGLRAMVKPRTTELIRAP